MFVCLPVFPCCYFTRLFGFAVCDFGDQAAIALQRSLRLGHPALRAVHIYSRGPRIIGPRIIDDDDNVSWIVIDRSNILDSSLNAFCSLSDDDLMGTLKVQFNGEEGQDAGGLFKEWMTLIAPRIFCWPLFLNVLQSEGSMILPVLRLNPIPTLNFDDADACHSHLRLLGAVLGFSVRRNIPLGVELTPAFCKLLLHQEPCFEDLKHEMPDDFEKINRIKQQIDCSSPSERQATCDAWFNSDVSIPFNTPSRSMQIKDFINALGQSNPDAHAALPQVGDELTSDLFVSTGPHNCVDGDNFPDFIIATVRKQLSSNLEAEALPHILPAFEAAAGASVVGMSYQELQKVIVGEADASVAAL